MNIYYKRNDTFCKYPWHQEIDERIVEFSLNKRRFKPFMKTDASIDMKERKKLVANHLKINVKKINLIKA